MTEAFRIGSRYMTKHYMIAISNLVAPADLYATLLEILIGGPVNSSHVPKLKMTGVTPEVRSDKSLTY